MTDLVVLQEEQDNSGARPGRVLVGLTQVTLYPTPKLHPDQLPGRTLIPSSCMMLVGMCLDDDVDSEDDEKQSNKRRPQVDSDSSVVLTNVKRRPPYTPPPVTWSQPVIVVPPEQDDTGHSHGTYRKRQILLHGRVARAMGVDNGDQVWFRLDGHKERQCLTASVDDRATFHVVMEAEWNTVRNLRPVALQVVPDENSDGEKCTSKKSSSAAFSLTPTDGQRQGVLYFDGVCVQKKGGRHRNHHHRGSSSLSTAAGTGFCIYSCQQEQDGLIMAPHTKLVSSFRFLGRPFCPNHAEYAALIEGLEWLFRFQFDQVWIVGPPQVMALLQEAGSRNTANNDAAVNGMDSGNTKNDNNIDEAAMAWMEIPQIQKANSIAQHMIEMATENEIKVHFHNSNGGSSSSTAWGLEDDEDEDEVDDEEEDVCYWEATELADTAIDLERNETKVYWTNIQEACNTIDLQKQQWQSETQSDQSQEQHKSASAFTKENKVETASKNKTGSDCDECSFLNGEEVIEAINDDEKDRRTQSDKQAIVSMEGKQQQQQQQQLENEEEDDQVKKFPQFDVTANSILDSADAGKHDAMDISSSTEDKSEASEGHGAGDDDKPIERAGPSLMDYCANEFQKDEGSDADQSIQHRQLRQQLAEELYALDCTSNSSTEHTGHLGSAMRSEREQNKKVLWDQKVINVQQKAIKEKNSSSPNSHPASSNKNIAEPFLRNTKRINLKPKKQASAQQSGTAASFDDEQSALRSTWMMEDSYYVPSDDEKNNDGEPKTPVHKNYKYESRAALGKQRKRRDAEEPVDEVFESELVRSLDGETKEEDEDFTFGSSFCHAGDAMEFVKSLQNLVGDLAFHLVGDPRNDTKYTAKTRTKKEKAAPHNRSSRSRGMTKKTACPHQPGPSQRLVL